MKKQIISKKTVFALLEFEALMLGITLLLILFKYILHTVPAIGKPAAAFFSGDAVSSPSLGNSIIIFILVNLISFLIIKFNSTEKV